MASLIGWLAYDGARTSTGAAVASGSAWFYQPGTTATQVTVFSDADGLAALTQPVALDAGGRATVFATAACRVEVQDSTGASVKVTDRANTVAAAQVEIQNAGATGTDLTTGAQVAGGRTDLSAFVSALLASNGAPDGKVLVAGVAVNLKSALITGIADVRQYGAAGDDTVNDTAALMAAINAMNAAGGGIVLVSPGTYKVTGNITVPSTVAILGVRPSVSIIKQYTAATDTLIANSGCYISGLAVTANTGTATGRLLSIQPAASGTQSFISGCQFATTALTDSTGVLVGGAATFAACSFSEIPTLKVGTAALNDAISISGGDIRWAGASTAFFEFMATATTVRLALNGVAVTGTAGAGTQVLLTTGTNYAAALTGCTFLGGTTLNVLSAAAGSTSVVTEAGCTFGTNVTLNVGLSSSAWRDHATAITASAAVTYTPDTAKYQTHQLSQTGGAAMAFQTPTGPPPGGAASTGKASNLLFIEYSNNSGGAITPTFSGGYIGSSVAVGNGQKAGWGFFYSGGVYLQMFIAGPW